MGHVLFLRKGSVHTAPVTYKANFADNTWAQIIDACHKNQVPETWVVGNQKAMTINGADYVIDIIGKGHDDYADGSGKAPLTFQLHDCYAYVNRMNSSNTNVGGWTSCAMRQTHLPAILALMPTEVQNGIREVNKLTSAGSVTYSKSGEGTQYDYYKAGNSKVKNVNGSANLWWERSPYASNTASFCIVYSDGVAYYGGASYSRGVVFGFCF